MKQKSQVDLHSEKDYFKECRRRARRTALLLAALALGFFVAFVMSRGLGALL